MKVAEPRCFKDSAWDPVEVTAFLTQRKPIRHFMRIIYENTFTPYLKNIKLSANDNQTYIRSQMRARATLLLAAAAAHTSGLHLHVCCRGHFIKGRQLWRAAAPSILGYTLLKKKEAQVTQVSMYVKKESFQLSKWRVTKLKLKIINLNISRLTCCREIKTLFDIVSAIVKCKYDRYQLSNCNSPSKEFFQ